MPLDIGELAEALQKAAASKTVSEANVPIERSGGKITLPADPPLSYEESSAYLMARAESEKQVMECKEQIDAFVWDGAIAFCEALTEIFGWVPQADGGFFKQAPTVVAIPTRTGVRQVHLGWFKVPGTRWELICSGMGNKAIIRGKGPRCEYAVIEKLLALTRKKAAANSIYRGQAIIAESDGTGDMDMSPLKFIKPTSHTMDFLVLPKHQEESLTANLFTPVRYSDVCRDAQIPLRRGVLISGPYGTGKTMTATAAAWLCEQHGWTFILVKDAEIIAKVLEFAQRYQPAMVFVEDVDRIAGMDRTDTTNDLLNTVDGVVSKQAEIITVMTTNHIERIHPAMLRPGRLDAVIQLDGMDEESSQRLIRLYAGSLIKKTEGLRKVGEVMKGMIPAAVREVVERSKLSAIARTGKAESLSADDLLISAKLIKEHLALIQAEPKKNTPAELLAAGLKEVVGLNGAGEDIEETKDMVREIHNQVA